MAQWPSTLPAPALNSFSETPPNNVIRSTMDKGPAKLRRRTTANVRPVSFSLNLTPDQVDVLDEFYNETTYGGVDAFDFEHPRTGDLCEARFAEAPQYGDREGVLYSATISLEILP